MPIFDYNCQCGHIFEIVYIVGERVYDAAVCPKCDNPKAARSHVASFAIVGPVWSNLDAQNKTLLTDRQRRNGMEFKTGSQIEKWESATNRRRMDSREIRTWQEKARDEASVTKQVAKHEGREGAAKHIARENMKESLGWDDAKLRRHESDEARVDAAVAAGRVALPG